jgi:hypothetical protein
MYSNKFDTPRQAAREKYYENDRKRGARILSVVVSRANRRLRTCNDRFRSKRELRIADAGRHCYCSRSSTGSALGSVFMKGSLRGRGYTSGVFEYYDSAKAADRLQTAILSVHIVGCLAAYRKRSQWMKSTTRRKLRMFLGRLVRPPRRMHTLISDLHNRCIFDRCVLMRSSQRGLCIYSVSMCCKTLCNFMLRLATSRSRA